MRNFADKTCDINYVTLWFLYLVLVRTFIYTKHVYYYDAQMLASIHVREYSDNIASCVAQLHQRYNITDQATKLLQNFDLLVRNNEYRFSF